jgi:hypothetical protein
MERDQELTGTLERRSSLRRRLVLAAQLQAPDRSRLGVTQDISRSGALLLSAGRFKPGESVDLMVASGRSNTEIHIRAQVVRAAAWAIAGPWRCLMAVRFELPLTDESALLVGSLT